MLLFLLWSKSNLVKGEMCEKMIWDNGWVLSFGLSDKPDFTNPSMTCCSPWSVGNYMISGCFCRLISATHTLVAVWKDHLHDHQKHHRDDHHHHHHHHHHYQDQHQEDHKVHHHHNFTNEKIMESTVSQIIPPKGRDICSIFAHIFAINAFCNVVTMLLRRPRSHTPGIIKSSPLSPLLSPSSTPSIRWFSRKTSNYPISECFHWSISATHDVVAAAHHGINNTMHQTRPAHHEFDHQHMQTNKQAHHDITQRNRCFPDFCKTVQRKHLYASTSYTVGGKREPAVLRLFCCWWAFRRQASRLEVAFKWGLLCDNCLTCPPLKMWTPTNIWGGSKWGGPLGWSC